MPLDAEFVTQRWTYSSRIRVAVAILCGVVAGVFAGALHHFWLSVLIGWDVAAVVYVLWVALTVFRLKEEATARLAESEDPDTLTADFLLFLASIVSLFAVGMALVESGKAEGMDKTLLISIGVLSVILSWLLVHTTFTLKYARMYYDECDGGINFNDKLKPTYLDFAYLAFTVGMTFQVSDTSIEDRRIRHVVLRHALISYLFGTVIVATTINLVAGLSK